MRFSDTFLRQVRDRVSIADYAGKRLAWDKRKSRPAAGDYWACCPFHQEKSASFHILDAKGIFNCFGCGEKGDVFGLTMKLEGLTFPEAVQKLAEYAGVPLPVDEREDRQEDDRRKRLLAIAARAAKLYAEALGAREGREARDYLANRGFNAELCARFGIGYAPGGYTWLIDKLKAENFRIEEIVAAGLARESDDGRKPIDTFRDRVTFEIGDMSGRVIAFGGRALAADAKAKYINSPECALYSKGRTLYRMKQAREIAAKTKANGLVVAEGYLDVIAFERAGIAAVAPCGTSLTEDQLALIWKAGGEPVLCFDGDSAGQRAAERARDLALPHLGPGRTVRIALLPQGEDPDDVYRRAGPEALKPLIASAAQASDALFQRESARRPLSTPEARADFKTRLKEAVNRIADADTRRLYFTDLMARADALLRPPKREWNRDPRPYGQRGAPEPGASPELRAAAARRPRPDAESFLRAAVDHPAVLSRYGEWIDRLAITDPDLAAIRAGLQALSAAEDGGQTIDRAALSLHLTRSGDERAAARLSRWPKPRAAADQSQAADGADLETEWLVLVTREVVLPAIKEELAELRPRADRGDDAAFARFQALSREARDIEARAQEAKLEKPDPDSDTPDNRDLVA